MKKILICSLLAIATTSFASEVKDIVNTENMASGSSITQTESTIKTPKAMNALPINKDIDGNKIQMIDQPKQSSELVGSNSATWSPAYLKVKSYKKCLDVQDYRGWQGLCMPTDKPDDCLPESWTKLQEMNLVPCAKV
jgi:hypothetical protein